MWFIFIQAHRFYTRTAYSPRRLAGRQAPGRSAVNRPIRRVGLAPTSATTFTGCCSFAKCQKVSTVSVESTFAQAMMMVTRWDEQIRSN
jgi:hypothetical protein